MSIKITIEGDGLSYAGETTIQKAARVLQYISAEDASSQITPLNEIVEIVSAKKATTPLQAVRAANANTNSEKIATFIKFYHDTEGKEGLKSQEIVKIFIKSGEPRPKNISRDLSAAEEKGYIAKSESVKGLYCLTHKGIDILEVGFTSKKDE